VLFVILWKVLVVRAVHVSKGHHEVVTERLLFLVLVRQVRHQHEQLTVVPIHVDCERLTVRVPVHDALLSRAWDAALDDKGAAGSSGGGDAFRRPHARFAGLSEVVCVFGRDVACPPCLDDSVQAGVSEYVVMHVVGVLLREGAAALEVKALVLSAVLVCAARGSNVPRKPEVVVWARHPDHRGGTTLSWCVCGGACDCDCKRGGPRHRGSREALYGLV